MADPLKTRLWPWLLSVALLVAVLALYWPLLGFDYLNCLDPESVSNNLIVLSGVHEGSLAWAWRSFDGGVWQPLTRISWMLGCQWFGSGPFGQHAINIILHSANVVLLFWLLFRLTGHLWTSALAAGLFAVHPLNIESVAWVAERKQVLGLFFALGCVWCYAGYTRGTKTRWLQYILAVLCFALALMANPWLLTLPLGLLVLDAWPLNRGNSQTHGDHAPGWRHFWMEKIPFLILSGVALLLSVQAVRFYKASEDVLSVPFFTRLLNTPLASLRYVGKVFWPDPLVVVYPWPPISVVVALIAAFSLVSLTAFLFSYAQRQPFLRAGWLWLFALLLPVIGLVQISEQPLADHFMYYPLIGMVILVSWWLRDRAEQQPHQATLWGLAGTGLIIACVCLNHYQLRYWSNSRALFTHANDRTQYNATALLFWGKALMAEGRTDEAKKAFLASAKISPNRVQCILNVGELSAQENKPEETYACFLGAVKIRPQSAAAQFALGSFLDAVTTNKVNVVLHLTQAVKLHPDYPEALNNLAWSLATAKDSRVRNGAEAVRHALHACSLTGYRYPSMVGTLAAAYAETGDFKQAVKTAQRAVDISVEQGVTPLVENNRTLMELYKAGKTFRQP
ncbi:MAG: hypothetical protein WCO56_02065 [Verrucomicrobiota bacterium]